MSWKSVSAKLAIRLLSWAASAQLHLIGGLLAMVAWPIILIDFCFRGIPSDDTFSFRWDNPYYRGGSMGDDDGEEPTIVLVPRPWRPIPELEIPRDLEDRVWDSRRLLFDESLGFPSAFETPFHSLASPGFHKAKGDSLDFVSDKPMRGKGTYDSLGAGGGGGGRYGGKIVLKDAVQLGLLWLARHQGLDGSWSAASLGERCGRALPNGRKIAGPSCESEPASDEVDHWTALAAMAFAGAGYFPDSPDVWDGIRYREIVSRACLFLSRPQRNAQARALAPLAISSLTRPPSLFDPPGRKVEMMPDRASMRILLAALESEARPAEGSDEAAWTALAYLNAARAGFEISSAVFTWATEELARRCETLPALEPGDWPGENLERSYLRLLASFQETLMQSAELPVRDALYLRLRAGQCRDADACREGSWEPVGAEGRLSTTLFHLLALQSLPGYRFRAGHPVRPSPEVIAREAMLRMILQERLDRLRAVPGGLRGGIERVRAGYLKRKDANVEELVREAFEPAELTYVRYVPTLEIGDHIESDNDEEFQKFKPLTRLGGNRDLITDEVYKGLCERDGIVGFDGNLAFVVPDKEDDLTALGRTLIFTLPDETVKLDGKPKWEKYVVIGFQASR